MLNQYTTTADYRIVLSTITFSRSMTEVRITARSNDAYKHCDTAKEDVANKNVKFYQKFGLKTSENQKKNIINHVLA